MMSWGRKRPFEVMSVCPDKAQLFMMGDEAQLQKRHCGSFEVDISAHLPVAIDHEIDMRCAKDAIEYGQRFDQALNLKETVRPFDTSSRESLNRRNDHLNIRQEDVNNNNNNDSEQNNRNHFPMDESEATSTIGSRSPHESDTAVTSLVYCLPPLPPSPSKRCMRCASGEGGHILHIMA